VQLRCVCTISPAPNARPRHELNRHQMTRPGRMGRGASSDRPAGIRRPVATRLRFYAARFCWKMGIRRNSGRLAPGPREPHSELVGAQYGSAPGLWDYSTARVPRQFAPPCPSGLNGASVLRGFSVVQLIFRCVYFPVPRASHMNSITLALTERGTAHVRLQRARARRKARDDIVAFFRDALKRSDLAASTA
jgi:hypothetical protein